MTTPSSTRQEVTQLLGDWSNGDEGALGKLFPLVPIEKMIGWSFYPDTEAMMSGSQRSLCS